MNFRAGYVPAGIDEAVQEILDNMTVEDRVRFFAAGGEVSHLYTTVGLEIRDAWRLCDSESPLVREFLARGIRADCDILADILALYLLQEAWLKWVQSFGTRP